MTIIQKGCAHQSNESPEPFEDDCFPNDYKKEIEITHWQLLPALPENN